MDSIRSMTFGRHNDLINVQVTFTRSCRTNQASLICIKYVASCSISFGKDCYSTDAHLTTRAHHTYSNFTTISDQYFLYHASCINNCLHLIVKTCLRQTNRLGKSS